MAAVVGVGGARMAGDAYGSGLAFRNFLSGALPKVAAVVDPVHTLAHAGTDYAVAAAPHIADFLGGVFGAPHPSVTVPLPPARPVAAKSVKTAAKPEQTKAVAAGQPAGVPTFDQMLQAYAGANGDKISLREMSALADIAAKTTATHHVPTFAEVVGQKALDAGDQLTQYKVNQAQAAGDKDAYFAALQERQDRLERLARARAIDPVSASQFDGN